MHLHNYTHTHTCRIWHSVVRSTDPRVMPLPPLKSLPLHLTTCRLPILYFCRWHLPKSQLHGLYQIRGNPRLHHHRHVLKKKIQHIPTGKLFRGERARQWSAAWGCAQVQNQQPVPALHFAKLQEQRQRVRLAECHYNP